MLAVLRNPDPYPALTSLPIQLFQLMAGKTGVAVSAANDCLTLEDWGPSDRSIAAANVDAYWSLLAGGEDPNLVQSDQLYPLICAAIWARAYRVL